MYKWPNQINLNKNISLSADLQTCGHDSGGGRQDKQQREKLEMVASGFVLIVTGEETEKPT